MTSENNLDLEFSKRFSANVISNIIFFILSAGIGILLAPFFLDSLGQTAYGLIPLATTLSSYITLLISSLNSSIARFLTIDLQKGKHSSANITFNTSVFGTSGLCLILLPVAIIIGIISPNLFNIGTIAPRDVILLFSLIFISVLIRLWGGTFLTVLFSYNRLDLRNVVEIINLIIQTSLIFILFGIFGPSLPLIGISYLIAAIISRIISTKLAKKVCPYLKINLHDFQWKSFKEIGNVALWMGFTALGGLLYSQIGLIIVNLCIGELATTQYSLCIIWTGLLLSIAQLVTTVFTPMIYSYYSKNDTDGLLTFTQFTLKIVGFFMALPIALIYVFIPEIMTVWVGEEYASLWPIIWILLLPVITQMQASCIYPINTAFKKVIIPAFMNFVAGIINVSIGLIFVKVFNFGLIGVALAYMTSMFFLTGCVSPFYNAYIQNAPKLSYFKYMVLAEVIMISIVAFGEILSYLFHVSALWQVIILALIISVIYLLILTNCILKKSEKILIRKCLPSWLEKHIPQWIL